MFEGLFQPMHLIIVLGIVLLVFGPKKLPELGRALGRSFAEFRRATTELKSTFEREIADAEGPAAKPQPPGQSVARSPAEPASSNGKTVGTEPV